MICYKDMTFCTFYKDCKKSNICSRPLTPQIEKEAKDFFKDIEFPPIARFLQAPDCYEKYNDYDVYKDVYDEKEPWRVKLPLLFINFKTHEEAERYSKDMKKIKKCKNNNRCECFNK